mmetsp:Transcript_80762/g.127564  ORF Transcript_80762/g.127564 Transcript_80762/m.127564 type:complete len:394 (+) Transcript_80762:337-1518(+)
MVLGQQGHGAIGHLLLLGHVSNLLRQTSLLFFLGALLRLKANLLLLGVGHLLVKVGLLLGLLRLGLCLHLGKVRGAILQHLDDGFSRTLAVLSGSREAFRPGFRRLGHLSGLDALQQRCRRLLIELVQGSNGTTQCLLRELGITQGHLVLVLGLLAVHLQLVAVLLQLAEPLRGLLDLPPELGRRTLCGLDAVGQLFHIILLVGLLFLGFLGLSHAPLPLLILCGLILTHLPQLLLQHGVHLLSHVAISFQPALNLQQQAPQVLVLGPLHLLLQQPQGLRLRFRRGAMRPDLNEAGGLGSANTCRLLQDLNAEFHGLLFSASHVDPLLELCSLGIAGDLGVRKTLGVFLQVLFGGAQFGVQLAQFGHDCGLHLLLLCLRLGSHLDGIVPGTLG